MRLRPARAHNLFTFYSLLVQNAKRLPEAEGALAIRRKRKEEAGGNFLGECRGFRTLVPQRGGACSSTLNYTLIGWGGQENGTAP